MTTTPLLRRKLSPAVASRVKVGRDRNSRSSVLLRRRITQDILYIVHIHSHVPVRAGHQIGLLNLDTDSIFSPTSHAFRSITVAKTSRPIPRFQAAVDLIGDRQSCQGTTLCAVSPTNYEPERQGQGRRPALDRSLAS